MNPYTVRYRRLGQWLWRKEQNVVGHGYQEKQNKMVLYYSDGSLREIANWTGCEMKLGVDWVQSTRRKMESEAGQSIPLNVS